MRRAALVLALAAAAQPATAGRFQRTAPPGHCRTVHGRLALYNGTFSFRIWVIGTHRMLRVVNREGDNFDDVDRLPAPLTKALADYRNNSIGLFDDQVFADFRVCDFDRSRPHIMQSVTLEDARRIRIVAAPKLSS